MDVRLTTLERAYELARAGTHESLKDIRQQLKEEGYNDTRGQLYGRSLQRALRELWQAARRK